MLNTKKYTVEEDFAAVLKGEIELPNAVATDQTGFLNNLAAVGHGWVAKWGWSKFEGHKQWTYFFLTPAGMGGRLDGAGYAVIYHGLAPKVLSFALCRHEKVDAPGANHIRGWHPGSCKHCGLDMTVDSGD